MHTNIDRFNFMGFIEMIPDNNLIVYNILISSFVLV